MPGIHNMKVYGAEIEVQREIDKSTIVMKHVSVFHYLGAQAEGTLEKHVED